jgi:hypothetical protein
VELTLFQSLGGPEKQLLPMKLIEDKDVEIMVTSKRILLLILVVSIVSNIALLINTTFIKNEKDLIVNSYFNHSTRFVSELNSTKSLIDKIFNQKGSVNEEDLINLNSSVDRAYTFSIFHDLSVFRKYGYDPHFSTIVSMDALVINNFVLNSLNNQLTKKDWDQLEVTYNNLEILLNSLDIDTMKSNDSEKINKMYKSIPFDQLKN